MTTINDLSNNSNNATISIDATAYYDFDGDADDRTGNGYDLTLNNSPTLTTDYLGNENNAYDFNGTNQYLSYDSFPNTSKYGTVLITFKIDTFVSYFGLFEFWDDSSTQLFRMLGDANGIRIYPYRDNVYFTDYYLINKNDMNATWNTIVITIDEFGQCKSFLNGNLYHTFTTNYKDILELATNKLFLANDPSAGGRYMDGQIAQALILKNYAMKESQVSRLQTLLESHKLTKQLVTEIVGEDSITGLEFFGVNDND